MGSSVQEEKMHYPVMTEKHLADRWQVSLKTLRRWRFDGGSMAKGRFGTSCFAMFVTTRPMSSSSSNEARST
jgi:hypothetical protein